MDEEAQNGELVPDNVIDLQSYARRRKRSPMRRSGAASRDDDSAHVYIDLENGELTYGLAKVTDDIALVLLKPWFYLGNELLKLSME